MRDDGIRYLSLVKHRFNPLPKVGVKVNSIKIKNMGYRWASCSQKGALNFHCEVHDGITKNN